jgi:hypothetical protein
MQRARDVLERDSHQRQIKWRATQALVSFRDMLDLMTSAERARWRTECEMVKSMLEQFKRGV